MSKNYVKEGKVSNNNRNIKMRNTKKIKEISRNKLSVLYSRTMIVQ